MPEPTLVEQPKIAAEAMFGREAAPGAVRTQEQKMAEKLRGEVDKDVERRQIMQSLAPHPPPNEGRIHHVNNESIGTRRRGGDGPDAGEKDYSGDRRGNERRRRVDRAAGIAREILEKGYDGISDDTGRGGLTADQKKEFLINEYKKAAMAWPESRAVLETYGDDALVNAKIEELFLRNPQVLKQLSQRFGEIYNGDGAILEDLVSEVEEEFVKADKKYESKNEELGELNRQLDRVERRHWELQPGGRDFLHMTRLKTESADWHAQSQSIASEISKLEREIGRLNGQLYEDPRVEITRDETGREIGRRQIRDKRPGVEEAIQRAEERIDGLRGDAAELQKKQSELAAFEKEAAEIEKKRNELKEKRLGLEAELADLDISRESAKAKLDVQRAARAAAEEEFVHDAEGMFYEAGMRFMKEEVAKYEAAQKRLAEKAISDASDEDEKSIMEGMRDAWRRDERDRRGRVKSKVNTNVVRSHYDRLIRKGSPEDLTKEFMSKRLVEIGRLYGTHSSQYKEEQARLQERFKDKEFMKRMDSVVAERLFKNYLESGGKIRKEDASILVETDWGEAALEEGINKNKKAGEFIDKLKEQGGFEGSRMDFLRKLAKDPRSYGVLAVMLALIVSAPFVAGAGIAAGEFTRDNLNNPF